MEYIFIAAVSLLLGFMTGFFLLSLLVKNNDQEEEHKQDLLLLKLKIEKLELENQCLRNELKIIKKNKNYD